MNTFLKLIKSAVVILLVAFICMSCSKGPKTELLYSNDFSNGSIGSEWKNEGGDWKIVDGKMTSRKALNKDLVLNIEMPAEAIIELDMVSHSEAIDFKFRAWGDKRGPLHDGAYHFLLGAWKNKMSTIAPFGEHDERRVKKTPTELVINKWYKVKVVRSKGVIDMFLDGVKYMSYQDTEPLDKNFFKYFSFANWKSDCEYDNLKIYKIVSK